MSKIDKALWGRLLNRMLTTNKTLFTFFLWLLVAASAHSQNNEAALEDVKNELKNLEEELLEYQKERDWAQSNLRAQELELSQIHKQIYDIDEDIKENQSRFSELQNQAAELDVSLKQQEKQLRNDLKTMYQTGSEEPLKILLNQGSPAEFSRMFHYYQYLLEARAGSIDSYLETMTTLDETKSEILESQNQLAQLSTALSTREEEQKRAQQNRTTLLQEIDSQIVSAEQLIAEKEEDRARLEQLIKEVEERIANLAPPDSFKPFVELKGNYEWPIVGDFAHQYGASRSGTLRWQGVVITAPAGNPVTTIHHGRVVFADYLRGYGLLVIVDHDDGYLSLYGHNQSLFVESGDWVAPGEQIALVGNSGSILEQGLYFEIRHEGEPQNPNSWVKR